MKDEILPGLVGRCQVTRMGGPESGEIEDRVVVEKAVDLVINGRRLLSFACLPSELRELAAGFLFAEGILDDPRAVSIDVSGDGGRIEVKGPVDEEAVTSFGSGAELGSGCGGSMSGGSRSRKGCGRIDTLLRISRTAVEKLMASMSAGAAVYKATGGAHVACLGDSTGRIILLSEDIGRHNAVDKVAGKALMSGIGTGDLVLCCSGRISSDIAFKAVRARVPVVVSRSAPTSGSVEIAARHLLTLVGFARGGRMNVYTAPERISGK